MEAAASLFTAGNISAAMGITPQAVRNSLTKAGVPPGGVKIVGGMEAAAWPVSSLPESLRNRLAKKAVRAGYGCADQLLLAPQWQPPMPLARLSDDDIKYARKLRDALRPWLTQQHEATSTAADREARGVEAYARSFGHPISRRHWRELFARAAQRDGGTEDWDRLEIYLPAHPKPKLPESSVVTEAIAEGFGDIETVIKTCENPAKPSKYEQGAVWRLALKKVASLVSGGMPEKRAERRVRGYLWVKAPFLAPSRDALRKAFKRDIKALKKAGGDSKALCDGREKNGDRVTVPEEDIKRLRHSAVFKNGGRVNAAWYEEYPLLSEETRRRYSSRHKAPRKIHELLVRDRVDALTALHQGKRVLKRMIGGVERSWDGIPSMHSWVVDDMTANIEVAREDRAGEEALFLPQVIAVMDSASRKIVGRSISSDRGPTAELSCEAVLDGMRREGVPKELLFENGFVFGKSLNVNGKTDEAGRTIVAGLGYYGCTIGHFEKMNPTSKAELEKALDHLQRHEERHPGYTGRLQMLDAPEDFKREQRLIKSGKVAPTKYRYTFQEFVQRIDEIIAEYNSKRQDGWLGGISPNEAFEALKDKDNPPIQFTPELHWLLANARYQVTVEVGGVKFRHYGRQICVRGGRLAETDMIGRALWALVDRKDDSLVTFMNLDHRDPFTMESCQRVSARERLIAPGSGVLAAERSKIAEHARAVRQEYQELVQSYGNPRQELLREIRGQSKAQVVPDAQRKVVISPTLANAGKEMLQQRAEKKAAQKEKAGDMNRARNLARQLKIPAAMVDDDPETLRGLEMLAEAAREDGSGGNPQAEPARDYQRDPSSSSPPDNTATEL